MDRLREFMRNNWHFLILLVGGVVYLMMSNVTQSSPALSLTDYVDDHSITIESSEIAQSSVMDIYIDIKGAIKAPGVYRLSAGSRLHDVIEMAGGVTEDADLTQVNQALLLNDQMLVIIPTINEILEDNEQQDIVPYVSIAQSESHKININSASSEELQTLPGIGPKKAEAIINHRQEYGSFKQVEELLDVVGIGTKTLEQLKDYVMVAP